ncbi:MAG: TRAP transporter small permease [Rhodobacteraceae bacterium]|jgi:TRAP-type C4-dicarboxylate transport system permease small subunit|nr:TRAP transporter small permease [Paracoccaceae bacterium]
MERIATLFIRIEAQTTRIALWGAIAFLVIAAALAIYQVTTRFAFGQPSTWSEVITRSAMIWAVFLGVAPAFREGTMITLEFVQTALPRRAGLALYQLSMVLTLVFFAILFWQGVAMADRVANQTLAALQVSIAWVYAALPVGSVFIAIAVVACMIRAARGGWPRPETDISIRAEG